MEVKGQLVRASSSFLPYSSRDQIQRARLGSKHVYLLSHLAGPVLCHFNLHFSYYKQGEYDRQEPFVLPFP